MGFNAVNAMSMKHGTSNAVTAKPIDLMLSCLTSTNIAAMRTREVAVKVLSRLVHARALVLPFIPSPIGPKVIATAVISDATGNQADVIAALTARRNNNEFVPPRFHQRIAKRVADSGR